MLTFDAENHKYYWNGKEVPGVSHILKTIGITRDYSGVSDFYRERGVHVHKAIELYSQGILDEASLDPENVLPYVNAYKSFCEKYKPVAISTEIMLYSEEHEFAGTFDFYGEIDGGRKGIIDYKSSENSDKAADLQLCAYSQLLWENIRVLPNFKLALELHGDGTYEPWFYRTPHMIWESVMDLYRWKINRRTQELKEPFYGAA